MTILSCLLLALAVTRIAEVPRTSAGVELSGVTALGGDRYLAVEDKEARAFELSVRLDDKGAVTAVSDVRSFTLEGRKDLEGCAYDPLKKVIWVSDESDTSIRSFSLATGKEISSVKIPNIFRQVRRNRSFESLSISPDGLEMWTANEDTLACDGPRAGTGVAGTVRLQRFVRKGADDPWRATVQYAYPLEPVVGGRGLAGVAMSGVSGLVALGKGSVLVLERECSTKGGFMPTCLLRLYSVNLSQASDISAKLSLTESGVRVAGKTLLYSADTSMSNYEGICLGPRLSDGGQVLLLVSDGGNDAAESILTLRLDPR